MKKVKAPLSLDIHSRESTDYIEARYVQMTGILGKAGLQVHLLDNY